MTDLSAFEGRDVLQTTLRVTRTGDGLSQAMAIEPHEWHVGDRVTLVIDAIVAKVIHEPIKDTEALVRVHVCAADAALPVERKLVQKVLDAHARAVALATEGQGSLELDPD